MKYIEHLELVLTHIPIKELYGLQASVMQEIQSISRVDATNLEIGKEVKEVLQFNCNQITMENEEEKQHMYKIEKKLAKVYNSIPDYAQEPEVTSK
jgi:hypothetical protein